MNMGDILSGQKRRAWLDETLGAAEETMRYYLGPTGIPDKLGAVAKALNYTDAGDMTAAADASRNVWNNPSIGNAAELAAAAGAVAIPFVGARMMNDGVDVIGDAVTSFGDDMMKGYDPNRVNIFGGINAKTADKAALARAQELAESGASRDDIWRDTGWFKGVDDKWRFEIDDRKAVNDIRGAAEEIDAGTALPLAGVIDHPELYKAYPEIAETKTTLWPKERLDAVWPGTYGGKTVNGDLVFRDDMIDTGRPLHEVQHLVQQVEGFEGGASPVKLGKDAYERAAGEVEARNVENRVMFDADLRRATPPWQTQDVPDDAQIIRMGDIAGPQASALTPAQAQAQEILDMLKAGRGSEVTDDMMAAADDMYLYDNYDLPMDEASRMGRAGEMGFDTETGLYHGGNKQLDAFNPDLAGKNEVSFHGNGIYSSAVPDYASEYARGEGGNVLPIMARRENEFNWPDASKNFQTAEGSREFTDRAQRSGYTGVRVPLESDTLSATEAANFEVVTFNPTNIRSRFARFDPRLSHLRNLSAGVAGAAALGMNDDEPQIMGGVLGLPSQSALRDYLK